MMKQITPAPPDALPDFLPADGPEEIAKRPGNGSLWLLILIPLIYGVFTLGAWSHGRSPQPPPSGPYDNIKAPTPSKLMVHVVGAVRRPGLYQLPFDARINDAVQRAKPLPDADVNALNLAAWAEDGSRIEVPRKSKNGEASPETFVQSAPQPAETPLAAEKTNKSTEKAAPTPQKPAKTPSRIVNLNRAGLDDLMQLPGIGPVMAQSILDYRKENGAFASVDDLDQVKGIGPKKLEKLRPWATVK